MCLNLAEKCQCFPENVSDFLSKFAWKMSLFLLKIWLFFLLQNMSAVCKMSIFLLKMFLKFFKNLSVNRNSCHRILCNTMCVITKVWVFWLRKAAWKFRQIFNLISQVPDKFEKKHLGLSVCRSVHIFRSHQKS